ncbi:MAG: hypothetical protein ABFD29_09620 [Anaerolineaceae bacterium]
MQTQSGFKDRTLLGVKASLVFDQQVGQFALRHQDVHILFVEVDQTIASVVKDSHANERCELSLSLPHLIFTVEDHGVNAP